MKPVSVLAHIRAELVAFVVAECGRRVVEPVEMTMQICVEYIRVCVEKKKM